MTFAQEIEEAAAGPIEEIVIVAEEHPFAEEEDQFAARRKAKLIAGQRLTWGEARPMLDYKYDAGYGGADCDCIWAWSADRVVFVSIYDGATSVEWVPRNPADGRPGMPGGG